MQPSWIGLAPLVQTNTHTWRSNPSANIDYLYVVPLFWVWPCCAAAELQKRLHLLWCRTAPPRNSAGTSERKAAGPVLWRTSKFHQTDRSMWETLKQHTIQILTVYPPYICHHSVIHHGSYGTDYHSCEGSLRDVVKSWHEECQGQQHNHTCRDQRVDKLWLNSNTWAKITFYKPCRSQFII